MVLNLINFDSQATHSRLPTVSRAVQPPSGEATGECGPVAPVPWTVPSISIGTQDSVHDSYYSIQYFEYSITLLRQWPQELTDVSQVTGG